MFVKIAEIVAAVILVVVVVLAGVTVCVIIIIKVTKEPVYVQTTLLSVIG